MGVLLVNGLMVGSYLVSGNAMLVSKPSFVRGNFHLRLITLVGY